jgi:hypothetical protein
MDPALRIYFRPIRQALQPRGLRVERLAHSGVSEAGIADEEKADSRKLKVES